MKKVIIDKMMVRSSIMSAAAAALMAVSVSPVHASEDFGRLPEGEGQETVFYSCVACHSITTVTNQRFSRRVWDEVLVWMVEDQGMPELPDDEREIVLNYLAKHLGAEE